MTTELTNRNDGDMGAFNADDEQLVRYLGLDPSKPQDRAAVAVCRHYGFDPLLKHVVVIPKGGVYITRDGLLNVAHRSGQLDGIVVEQDPTLIDGEWVAKVTVHRKDMRHGFTFPGRYPQAGGNRQYAPEMALKAAEAHALRRAFDIGGLPTYDEQRAEQAPAERQAASSVSVADFAEQAPEPKQAEPEGPTKAQTSKMFAALRDVGCADRASGLAYVSDVIGREIGSSKELTRDEVSAVIEELDRELQRQADDDAQQGALDVEAGEDQ